MNRLSCKHIGIKTSGLILFKKICNYCLLFESYQTKHLKTFLQTNDRKKNRYTLRENWLKSKISMTIKFKPRHLNHSE